MSRARLAAPERAPDWLRPLLAAARDIDAATLSQHRIPAPADGRRAAVLVLFGEDAAHGPDVLLMERASTLRDHPGQVAFPGGGADPTDAGPGAHRAARGRGGDRVCCPRACSRWPCCPTCTSRRPASWSPRCSRTGRARSRCTRSIPRETAAVVRVPVAALADPANRLRVRHPSGYVGPAFVVAGLLVWGFTGGILSALLDLGGWAQPWDTNRTLGLDEAWASARAGRREVAG